MAPRGGEHLDLQAALALGKVDLGHQLLRGDLDARGGERGGEGRRTALVLALRKERHLRELEALVQRRRQRLAQRGGLRGEARAAAEGEQNKNARYAAGVFQGLAAGRA